MNLPRVMEIVKVDDYLQRVQNLPPRDFQAKSAPHVSPEFRFGALESCGNLRIAGPAVVRACGVNM